MYFIEGGRERKLMNKLRKYKIETTMECRKFYKGIKELNTKYIN